MRSFSTRMVFKRARFLRKLQSKLVFSTWPACLRRRKSTSSCPTSRIFFSNSCRDSSLISEFFILRHPKNQPISSRSIKRQRNGNLPSANRSASRAKVREHPATSKRTWPGLIVATHFSTGPLPLPIRVSAGFFVTGLWGKTLIQTFPLRLRWRVMATRAASICEEVM